MKERRAKIRSNHLNFRDYPEPYKASDGFIRSLNMASCHFLQPYTTPETRPSSIWLQCPCKGSDRTLLSASQLTWLYKIGSITFGGNCFDNEIKEFHTLASKR